LHHSPIQQQQALLQEQNPNHPFLQPQLRSLRELGMPNLKVGVLCPSCHAMIHCGFKAHKDCKATCVFPKP
jgi:hypothetical protein